LKLVFDTARTKQLASVHLIHVIHFGKSSEVNPQEVPVKAFFFVIRRKQSLSLLDCTQTAN
jgi:hypothetical protein